MDESRITPWRIKTYPRAVAFAASMAFAFTVVTSYETLITPAGYPLGADYLQFYAGGTLVAEGRADDLFDAAAVRRAQAAALGHSTLDGYHFWVYPPYVAAVFAPLARLPYLASFLVYTALLIGSLWWSARLLVRIVPELSGHHETVFLLSATFYPMLRSWNGGQNTAISLLLLSAAGVCLLERRDCLLGICLGAFLYKPHLALIAILCVASAGRLRAVGVSICIGLCWYLLGAAVFGWDWPARWWESLAVYRKLEGNVNGGQLISFLGVTQRLLGTGSVAGLVAGGVLSAATIACGLWVMRVRRQHGQAEAWAFVSVVVVIASPHTLFYDLGLLTVLGAVLFGRRKSLAIYAGGAIWTLSWAHAAFTDPWIQPLFFFTLAGLWVAARLVHSRKDYAVIN